MLTRNLTKGPRTQIYFQRFRMGEQPQGPHLLAIRKEVRSIEIPRLPPDHKVYPLRMTPVIPLFGSGAREVYLDPSTAVCREHGLSDVPVGANADAVSRYLDLVDCALEVRTTGYDAMLTSIQTFGTEHGLPVDAAFFEHRRVMCQREEAQELLNQLLADLLLYGTKIDRQDVKVKWQRIKMLVPNVETDFALADLYDLIVDAWQEANGNWSSAVVNTFLPPRVDEQDVRLVASDSCPSLDFLSRGLRQLFEYLWRHHNEYTSAEKISHDLNIQKATSLQNLIQRLRQSLEANRVGWHLVRAHKHGIRLEKIRQNLDI